MSEQESSVWMFDGKPELVGASVPDASAQDGGYIMVFVLESGSPRIVATRFPGKHVTSWKSRAARYGGEALHRVLVTKAHPRDEKIKRLLSHQLSMDVDSNTTPEPLTPDQIGEKITGLFETLSPGFTQKNLDMTALH
jgi:hypothetical protein